MRPQLQRYPGNPGETHGDCHRTCIAMILDIDRDEVPHFMEHVLPGEPAGSPASLAAEQDERDWLYEHGLTPAYVPYPGELDLGTLLEQLRVMMRGTAVILGCRSARGHHSVVVYRGRIYNPAGGGTVVGPMSDGMWWVTIYAHLTNPLTEPVDKPDEATSEHLPAGDQPPNVVTEQEKH